MKQSNSWCSIVILFWETMTMDNNDPSLLCRSLPNNSSTPFQKKYSPFSTTTSPHCHSQFASVTSHHSLEPTRQQGTNTMWKISPSSGCIEYSQPWRGGRLGEVGWRGRAHQKEDPLHQHQLVSYRRYFIRFETGRSMNNWDTHECAFLSRVDACESQFVGVRERFGKSGQVIIVRDLSDLWCTFQPTVVHQRKGIQLHEATIWRDVEELLKLIRFVYLLDGVICLATKRWLLV